MQRLHYVRHLLLLVCFGVLLHGAARRGFLGDLSVSFACYGALHASAVALALRTRQAVWRGVRFVSIAAALSVLTLRIGIVGMKLIGTLPGNLALYLMLGFAAMISAVSYWFLVRLYAIPELTLRSLAVISAACILATYAGFFALAHTHWLGRWLLAIFWWSAFSGGLWYYDRRPHRSRTVGRAHVLGTNADSQNLSGPAP